MSKTISSSYSSGITLANAGDNPVLVTGTINAATGIALYATTAVAWSITNKGIIETKDSSASGVRLGTGSSIDNASGGLIENLSGIAIYSAASATGVSVLNAGSIAGNTSSGTGIELLGGGSVSNASGGTITAGNFGVAVNGGTVTNRGVITSSNAVESAVQLSNAAGTVSNQSGGTIADGGNGIDGTGAADTVVNAGLVRGTSANGIALVSGGGITNQAGGTIVGGTSGIYVHNGAGVLVNNGLVTATGAASSAVDLASGGTVTNKGTGNISAATGIVITGSAGTVVNSASITGTGDSGVSLGVGGRLTNTSSGTITGAHYGVRILTSTASVVNHGTIAGGSTGIYGSSATLVNTAIVEGTSADGVELTSGGNVTNLSGGTISGNVNGIYVRGGRGVVINDDLISVGDVNRSAIDLAAGGSVTNASTATISASATGVVITGGTGAVVNAGTIIGTSDTGILLAKGGQVTNTSSGTITGANYGVRLQGAPGTVVTGGTIAVTNAGERAVYLSPGFSDLLVVDPGAVFDGTVDGGNAIGAVAVSTLELASGAAAGTLSGLGTQIIDFARITVASAASWTIASTVLAGQTLSNSGTLTGVVLLAGGARVTNTSSGTITGSAGAIYAPTSAVPVTIANAGSIAVSGTSGTALNLDVAASISNIGKILGANVAVDIQGVATVVNKGSIGASGSGGSGVNLRGGGVLSNASTGTITGLGFGAYLGNAGTLINDGSLQGTGSTGIAFSTGGTVANHKGATITGHYSAVGVNGGFGVITNDGAILAPTGTGLALSKGATVTNFQDGTISAQDYGIELENAVGTVVNEGSLNGNQNDGAALFLGGSISNASTGTITGYGGVAISGGAGTIINAGSIGATGNFALRLAVGYTNLLIVDPGATFNSHVDGGNTIGASQTSTLELASGASTGLLSGLGVQFIDFAQITVDANASWTLDNSSTVGSGVTLTALSGASVTIAGALENDGAIVLDPSTLAVGSLAGTGSVTIEAGSTLDVQATVSTGATIGFAGSGAYLHFDTPGAVAGDVTNFDRGETIDLKGIDPASVSFHGGKLNFTGGSFPLALANPHPVTASASGDGAAVTLLCFCVDTLILTPSGEHRVQHLAIGDTVVTASGTMRRIVWIGTGSVLATRGRRGAATPVIVRRGALGDNVPNRDLRLTKGHALYLEGALIPVEYLVNHRTIEWDDRAVEVELYHIELETHDVLVANGASAESYRDDGNRWLFRNANTSWGATVQEPYAAVLTGGPVVDMVWQHLMDRAGARPGLPLTTDPDLHLVVDGCRIDAVSQHSEAHIFALATCPREVRIVSRCAAPDELGVARDPRVLGIALRQIVLRRGTRFHSIKAADARLAEGFHAFEATKRWRWTNGDAVVPATLFDRQTGPIELVLHVGCTSRYAIEADARSVA